MYLQPAVTESEARRLLCPRRSACSRWFLGSGPVLERVELLHMPFHLFEARFAPSGSQQRAGTEPRRALVVVDALFGEAMPLAGEILAPSLASELFDPSPAGGRFDAGSPASPAPAHPAGGPHPAACAPELTSDEARSTAERFARGLALQWAMRWKSPESLAGLVDRGVILYPVWVGYLRRRGRYDFRAIDAVSGEPWVGKLRRMLLRAFRRLDPPGRLGPETERLAATPSEARGGPGETFGGSATSGGATPV